MINRLVYMLRYFKFYVLVFSACGLLMQCRHVGEKSIYLIPRGFVGNVVIVFEQIRGIPAEYKKGMRVYRIPSSGILKTQFKPNYGLHVPDEYYYISLDGKLTKPLRYISDIKSMNTGSLAGDTICFQNTPVSDSNKPRNNYNIFLVSPELKSDSIYNLQNSLISKLSIIKK